MTNAVRRFLLASSALAMIVVFTGAGTVAEEHMCKLCLDQCEGGSMACLGNANCPWPTDWTACAPSNDCAPWQVQFTCYHEH